ncbi:CEF1 [Candida jiufengensis]|uniref:CEF1 n=1 Tax=Candida jiufengensis TaxID=497108 RepID=UPI00222515E1|nr:CEF1 [Candida jiufengensis]KAI5951929.1 CEF1 [Candida jiufengensis]
MSTYVKGGAWTNIEDEILKAAVQKYGTNQWARVSSLLPKKTAQQAKSRWVEWLNPLINKSDWTQEQDKRLIELHKILPNQWRSIASIIGRTATQCVERYQHLLDKASGTENNEFKLSGPGIETLPATGQPSIQIFDEENDPNFASETKPPESDDEDMEDEDREMIAEAKARLANTQGKKAKRKARERMLEESKRLALLQKRRDLKAAGINISLKSKNKRKRKEFDYNADIPHEIIPGLGPYDVSEENKDNEKELNSFKYKVSKQGISNKEVDDKIRSNREKQKRADQRKRRKEEDIEDDKNRKIEFKKRKLDNENDMLIDEDNLEVLPNIRKPNKSVIPILKAFFDKLPEPIHHQGKPTPIITENQDEILLQEPTSVNNGDVDFELLKSIGEEKSRLQKSQVIQRNLPVINPSSIKKTSGDKSEIETLVETEFMNIVTADYKSQMNPFINIPILTNYDQILSDEVNDQISKELKSQSKLHENLPNFELPRTFDVAEMVISKLHDLHNSSQIIENSLNSSSREYDDKLTQQLNQINEAQLRLAEVDEEFHSLHYKIGEDEKTRKKENKMLHEDVKRINDTVELKRNDIAQSRKSKEVRQRS